MNITETPEANLQSNAVNTEVTALSDELMNTDEKSFDKVSLEKPFCQSKAKGDKDYDRIVRSCEDNDIARIFSISSAFIHAMVNENFRNIEEVSNQLY